MIFNIFIKNMLLISYQEFLQRIHIVVIKVSNKLAIKGTKQIEEYKAQYLSLSIYMYALANILLLYLIKKSFHPKKNNNKLYFIVKSLDQ